jgi:predicted permease
MGDFFRRIRFLVHRRDQLEALENDMAFHREMAAREGRSNFGNAPRLQEEARESWGWTWIDRLLQDMRFAARILRRSPSFTLIAVLVLAIGIGVNIGAFSLFNMLVLKPLPVRDPATLVRLQRQSPCCSASELPYGAAMFYARRTRTLEAVIGTMGGPPIRFENDAQTASAIFVTGNYFAELNSAAAAGRLLDPSRDDQPGAAPVAVLDYGFWQQRYAADPSVVGKVIHLNNKAVTVVGVTAFDFASLDGQRSDIWLPIALQPYLVDGSTALTDMNFGHATFRMWGRLAAGVSKAAADQELRALTSQLRSQYPNDIWQNEHLLIEPAGSLHVMHKDEMLVVAIVATLMLLILAVACANLGGLLLARGVTREREIGIRTAVGASAVRIFRQLFTESLLLALLGSAAGLGLGYVVVRIMLAALSAPPWMSAAPDWRVLLFAATIAVLAAVFFGFAPALQIARQRQHKTLVRQVLIGAQLAASCVLLIVSGLLVHAVHHALYTSPGFGYERVVSIDPGLSGYGYSPAAARALLEQYQSRLRAVPGVLSVALSSMPPLGHGRIETIGTDIGGRHVVIYPFRVGPDFFTTMGIALLRGRNFYPGEANAVIVSDSLARQQWPGEDPLGKQLPLDGGGKETVIGVAGTARLVTPNDSDAMETYHAVQPSDMPGMLLVVKANAPADIVPAAKSIAQALDPRLMPYIRLLGGAFRENMQGAEKAAAVATLLGAVAMLIAAVGILGLVAFTVSQRSKEIAIRLALGAGRADVLTSVLEQFLWPAVLGVGAGTALTLLLSHALRQALYGLSNLDPLSYGTAIVALVVIALGAALLPARRALKVDVARTLHCE